MRKKNKTNRSDKNYEGQQDGLFILLWEFALITAVSQTQHIKRLKELYAIFSLLN